VTGTKDRATNVPVTKRRVFSLVGGITGSFAGIDHALFRV
jgi:hypothetical protein